MGDFFASKTKEPNPACMLVLNGLALNNTSVRTSHIATSTDRRLNS